MCRYSPHPEDFWRLTDRSLTRLITDNTDCEDFEVEAHGNLVTSMAFLMGMASGELTREELDHRDFRFPIVVCREAAKEVAPQRATTFRIMQAPIIMQAPPKAVILMYHRITRTELDPWGMCVSPENFSEQLESIRRVATPMSLVDFVRARQSGDLPERAVVVTFDDGYVDNFEVALPILRQHRVPATLFVATCNIGTDREFWWDRLETLLLATGTLPETGVAAPFGQSPLGPRRRRDLQRGRPGR